jgi:sulfofructose kinase
MKIEILCIGHAAWDLVLPLESFPAENEKYAVEDVLESPGGPACNAASLLGKWGCGCAFAGPVGRDARGGLVLERLGADGVDTSLVVRPDGFLTPFSLIITSAASASRTIINRRRSGAALALEPGRCAGWQPRLLLFDGHEPEASLAALELFPAALSILDAGSRRRGTELLAARVDYLVGSERFARDMTGRDTRDAAGLEAALRALHELNGRQVALTLGERGCVYLREGVMLAQAAWPARAVDTTAAGDIFHGAFAAALLEGAGFPAAVGLATVAAGLSVERRGGYDSIPERAEVMARYREFSGTKE